MLRILVALTAVLIALPQAPAQAQLIWPPMVCTSYFSAGADKAPDEVRAFFRDWARKVTGPAHTVLPQIAIRKCDNGERRFYTMQFPARFDLGVCHFEEASAADIFSKDGKYLGMDAPASSGASQPMQRMLVSPEPCPTQDDTRYVAAAGSLPPGIFRELLTTWQHIVSNPAVLTQIASLRADDARASDELAGLMAALRAPPPHMLHVGAVEAGEPRGGRAAFELNVYGHPGSGGWLLGFDLSEKGWRLVSIATWVA